MKTLTKSLVVSLFIIFVSSLCFAEQNIVFSKIENDVFILKKGDFRKKVAVLNQGLFPGDLVITGFESSAVIKTNDNSQVVLDENSRLEIKDFDFYSQDEGSVYYNIAKKEQTGFKVKTSFAVIGVKGTEFIINSEKENKQVALKNGLVAIDSLDKEFKLHREKELSAFEEFMLKTKSAFSEYKKKDREEFVEYVKTFELVPNKVVSFSGNIVKEEDISQDLEKEFLRFRDML